MSGWHQLSAGQRSSLSPTPLRWWPRGLPHSLIGQPAGVALVEAILIGGLQLLGRGDDGAVLQAGPLRPVKVQGALILVPGNILNLQWMILYRLHF